MVQSQREISGSQDRVHTSDASDHALLLFFSNSAVLDVLWKSQIFLLF